MLAFVKSKNISCKHYKIILITTVKHTFVSKNHSNHTGLSYQIGTALLRVYHHEAVETHLFVWLVSESGVRSCSDSGRGAQGLDWVTHTGHIPEDWAALLCTAQLTALSSSLWVSETNSSCASAASPSLPFTRTVAARGKAGGAAGSVISTSLTLSLPLSLTLALFPSGSVLLLKSGYRQLWLGKWTENQWESVYRLTWLPLQVFMLCVCVWDTAHSDNNAHKQWGKALLCCSPFSPPPPTHPPIHPLLASPTPACWNESSAISQSYSSTQSLIRITGVFMHSCFEEMKMKWELSRRTWHTLLWAGKIRWLLKKIATGFI